MPTTRDMAERKKRAKEWKEFRKNHLFTQKKLAEVLGISRRTIQMIENSRVSPKMTVLGSMRTLQTKYNQEGQ